MFSQKSNRVSPAIGMVARVQAKRNALRVSLFQKGFDLVFILDVGLDMGMKNEFKPKAIVDQIAQGLCRIDQPLPPVFVKTARARRLAGVQIDVDVVEEHHIFPPTPATIAPTLSASSLITGHNAGSSSGSITSHATDFRFRRSSSGRRIFRSVGR